MAVSVAAPVRLLPSCVNTRVAELILPAQVRYGILLELWAFSRYSKRPRSDKWHRPLRVVSSICCTRVLLNIRGAYFNPNETSNSVGWGKEKNRWGSSSMISGTNTSTTIQHSDRDSDQLGEARGNGWIWKDVGVDPSMTLTLRSISPFHCELPDNVWFLYILSWFPNTPLREPGRYLA